MLHSTSPPSSRCPDKIAGLGHPHTRSDWRPFESSTVLFARIAEVRFEHIASRARGPGASACVWGPHREVPAKN
jgi:hypothetical protein